MSPFLKIILYGLRKISCPTLDDDDNDVIEGKLLEKVRRMFSKDCFYNRKWWWARNRLQTRGQYKKRHKSAPRFKSMINIF